MEADNITENLDELNETDDAEVAEVKQSNSIKTPSSIPQKKQPEQLCNCPLHCDTKIGKEWREKIYNQFGELGDHAWQNQYIQRHIKIKSIAKRLWEDEIIDKKIQRRVTCKYLIPVTGSVKESYSYSKTLDYDSVKFALDTTPLENTTTTKGDSSTNVPNGNENTTENTKKLQTNDTMMEDEPQCNVDTSIMEVSQSNGNTSIMEVSQSNGNTSIMEVSQCNENTNNIEVSQCNENTSNIEVPQCNGNTSNIEVPQCNGNTSNIEVPQCNGNTSIIEVPRCNGNISNTEVPKCNVNGSSMELDTTCEIKNSENCSFTKENITDVNSPMSFNDNESINTADESNISELDNTVCLSVKYVEVCQKAFMNTYGITEKRIRWQREKLILRSRYLAEKKKKELEEMDRTLSLARSLGAGCQPLFAMLEKTNCKQLSEQLLIAIEDDVMLVNNFFHNQLWKPEDIMNKSVHFSTLDSYEAEYD